MSIGILIADDQALVRAGFRMILEAEQDLRVLAEAKDGAEAVEAARRVRPDIVLMDIRMPKLDGLEATRRIMAATDQPPRVLMLTTFDLDEYVFDALHAGASGFLLKDVRRDDLVQAVRVVAAGESLLAPTVTRRLIGDLTRNRPREGRRPAERLRVLTARELETLMLLGRGLSNAEIAAAMTVTEHTVKTHVSNVLSKLGLRDRVQAVITAYETGLISPGS
jgi:DNA-binding NarL/FixJ family response regulator